MPLGFQLGPAPGVLPLKTGMGEKKEGGLSDEEGFLRRLGEEVGTGRMEKAWGRRESTHALHVPVLFACKRSGWKHTVHVCWALESPGDQSVPGGVSTDRQLRPVSQGALGAAPSEDL